MAEDLWDWCLQQGVLLEAVHIPGKQNVKADRLSRVHATAAECRISERQFDVINAAWGPHTVDLFASRVTARLPRYYARFPDHLAAATDALVQDWSSENSYAFPPFILIGRVLNLLMGHGGWMTLVAPHWTSQAWWPTLLELAEGRPPLEVPFASLENPSKPEGLPKPSVRLNAWRLFSRPGRRLG
jgi:hypothetical protein